MRLLSCGLTLRRGNFTLGGRRLVFSRSVVEIDVLDHSRIEGDIGADSNGRVGVKMEWDY
jgi:hypothetical protein